MAKHELFNNEYDTYDELADEDVKSPKKAKKETKVKQSPGGKGAAKRGWTTQEDEALMDCLGEVIAAHMSQIIKENPALSGRTSDGCVKHWISWRRKLETTLLGAPTVDANGKKLNKQDVVKPDDTE